MAMARENCELKLAGQAGDIDVTVILNGIENLVFGMSHDVGGKAVSCN
jgi:hypothetical protein